MKHLFMTILSLLLTPSLFAKEEAEIIENKLLNLYAPTIHFNAKIWMNPAIKYDMLNLSISSPSIGGVLQDKDGDSYLVQEGYSDKKIKCNVESFYKLSDTEKIFGSASYTNGRVENMLWNENADFSILYPYVTGDSIGGYMLSEEYYFSGGYVNRFRVWTAGAEFSYRASISYRDKDPRPRNVVSDLKLKIGLSRSISRYRIGASFSARKYKQNSHIAFLADKGSVSVYHMLGFGVDYARFAGDETSTNYAGHELGGSIEFIPENHYGFSLSLGGEFLHITKFLTNLNHAPIADINEKKISLDASWLEKSSELEYGVMLHAEYLKREGTEHILGDPTGNIYPVISEATQFHSPILKTSISGTIGKHIPKNRWGWNIDPHLGYMSIHPSYTSRSRYMKVSSLHTGIKIQSLWQIKKMLVSVYTNVDYTAKLSSDYALHGLNLESSLGKTILSNISYLSDTHTSLSIGSRIDYYINHKNALFLSGEYIHRNYNQSGVASLGEINIGFTF